MDARLSPRLERRQLEAARRPAATTPRRLRRLSTAIAALAVALTVVGAGALAAAEVTSIGIQQRTAPAIVGMQRIHAWLSDADRSAANAYLAGGAEVTLPELQYESDIGEASRGLQTASADDPGGGGTSQRLQAIATLVGQYQGLVQTANVAERMGGATATVYLEAATSLMHRSGSGILAQVDALRGLYLDDLDRANQTLRAAQWMLPVYLVLAIGLGGLLVFTQLLVRRRFHRRRSPRLLAATLLLVVVVVGSGAGAVQARQTMSSAEDQKYARLLNLWSARSLLADADGDESLWLIAHDQLNRDRADQAFQAAAGKLVDRPLTDAMMQAAAGGDVRFGGLLANELRAASPGPEWTVALHVLRVYRTFMSVDTAVRAKAAQGAQADAITLALGTDRDQLTFAFADVDWYLGLAIQHLQRDFDQEMAFVEQVLAASAAVELLALAIAALTFWGVRPRIEEFRAGR